MGSESKVMLGPLSFNCPRCGSADVVYSCTPSCCFNHVCSQCYATFEPKTERIGDFEGEIVSVPEADGTGPTASCARCGEYQLLRITGEDASAGQVVCVSCRALLTLELESD